MRELHVVALSEDGRHVVLATRPGAPSGEFRIALDERLTAVVRGELPAPGRDAAPSISPRDIQARLRDGESPDEIAASAGVPLSRVERYAGPVLAELERMITGARSAVVSRPRLGASARPLGEAVEAHLAEVAHLAEGSVRWSARRADLGRWVVSVSWTARGRRRTAGWHYDPTSREVTAVDGPSAVLGHVEVDAVAAPAPARIARPAAAAPTGTGRTTATASSSTPGRSVRTPAEPRSRTTAAAGATRTGATSSPSTAASRAASAQAGPTQPGAGRPTLPVTPPTTSRRATPRTAAPATAAVPPTPAATTPSRRAQAPAAPTPAAAPAAATPPPARSTRRRAAAAQELPPASTTARVRPRRPAARRSAVPSLDELAGATADLPAAQGPAPSSPTPSSPAQPPGPPVLRVVPPAAPEPEPSDAAAPPHEARPARRAAGQRAGGRDWADVLMGGGPAPPAAEPRQD